MENNGIRVRLLPRGYKKIGWGVIVAALLFYILSSIFLWNSKYIENYVLLAKSISVVGFLFVMLAREEEEDERSFALRNRLFAGLFVGLIAAYVAVNLQIVAHNFIGHKFSVDFNYFIFCVSFFYYLIECREQNKEELGGDNKDTKKILGMSSRERRIILYIIIFSVIYNFADYILPYFKF